MSVVDMCPKVHKLSKMIPRESALQINLLDPSIINQGLGKLPILALGRLKNERSNIFGQYSIKPRSFPKRSFIPVPQRDFCGRIEDIQIVFDARVVGARPNLVQIRPLHPRPTKPESRNKLAQVQHSDAAIAFGMANRLPNDLALGPIG
jgi:hypothetical protein